MKFSTREDIEATIEAVFAECSDTARFERQARRRAVTIKRLDRLPEFGPGMCWAIQFPYRGKNRRMQVDIKDVSPGDAINLEAASGGIDAWLDLSLMALSKNRTRLKIGLELKPRSLQARLLIQSLKFAKGNLDRKFAERVNNFAREIELRHNPSRALGL